VAAEHDDMNSVHIGKQSQGAERKIFSCHGTICGNSEIVQFEVSEETSSLTTAQVNPVHNSVNDGIFAKKAIEVWRFKEVLGTHSHGPSGV
jgi:hypothetical protein